MAQKHYSVLGIFVVLVVILINGCIQKEPIGGKATSPVKIEMNMLQTPKLNDIVTIEFKVTNEIPHSNPIQVSLILPEGFEFVEGYFVFTDDNIVEGGPQQAWRWVGDLSEDQTIILTAKVKAVKVGEYWLVGSSVGAPVEGGQFVADDVLFVTLNETSGEILRERPSS